ncbi:TVP38/TMEM64 family protein [Paraliomyxa miuraensis]|uniref:TVP38/TMEM64 family protein n=1 Tax=Paraliomyxa miuraensis TaxID=376150 RepID=UPI00224ED9A1|nr:VTT domain-containing protein [Paraliomyxa miuraensis]MCX4240073.1 VTT domain-containing protein [Paraliomyxa miuraensis]
MGPRRARLLVGLLYLALFCVVVALDVSAAEGQAWLRQAGGWGLLAFVIAFALLQPLGMASHLFVVVAALVWSPWVALSTSWIGALAAGCVAFGFSRYVAREFVQARLPGKLRPWDERLATRGFRTVLTMRLLLFTFGPMQLMFGVSRVRFASFVAGSALGLLPMLAVETFVGGSVVEWIWPGSGSQP